MKSIKWVSGIAILMLVCFASAMHANAAPAKKAPAAKAPAAAKAPDARTLWTTVATKWDKEIKSYTCSLFSYTLRQSSFKNNYPELWKPEDKKTWDYRVFNIKFKKPNKILFTYFMSKNEDFENGSLIDKGVAYMLAYAKGTTFNFGYKDAETVYIVFPYLKNSEFEKMPVPMVWKAAMKILMIASRKEVYHKTIPELKDLRGNMISDLSIGRTMKRYETYFKTGKVTLSKSPLLVREDFVLNEKTGIISAKAVAAGRPTNVYKLTMVPKDVKKNKGITKVETFIDPATMMFVGLIEYEGKQPVSVMLFDDLVINPEIPDKLWDDFFKGRTLSDKA